MAKQQAQLNRAATAGQPKEERTYYLVNPAGAVHPVSYEHARWRLGMVGYRTATAKEVAEFRSRGGNQVHNNPIAAPWSPEPAEYILSPAEGLPEIEESKAE